MKFVCTILFILICIYLSAQTNISGIINSYSQVSLVYYSCPDSLQVTNTNGFSTGDSIMIIQMKGAIIDTTNSKNFGTILSFDKAGDFEFVKINSINGNIIHLTSSLMHMYDLTGNVQIVSYPVYSNAVVTDTLTAQPWNGSTGGILLFSVLDSLTLNADIDLDGKGFIGGDTSSNYSSNWFTEYSFGASPGRGGEKGEGIASYLLNKEYGRAPQANGGGGGMDVNSGGAGGANYGSGGHGGNDCLSADTLWGINGNSLDSGLVQKKIFLGGGGGGGHQDNSRGTPGSNGGGIIFLRSQVLTGNNHFIKSNGVDIRAIAGNDGAGGGGAGGTVILNVSNFNTNVFVEARGGKGGDQDDSLQCHGNGGGGGGGIILFADTSKPSFVSTCILGGAKGNGQCSNTPRDGIEGDSGIVQFSWGIPKMIIANAGPDISICPGAQLNLGTTSQAGLQYQWSNGVNTSNQTISPSAPTSLLLTVTDGNCHYGYDSVYVGIYPTPTSTFTYNVNCDQTHFNISPNGTNAYLWNFGDGNSSSNQTPTHTYLNSGIYQANLTVANNYGCTTASTQSITINLNQQPAMTYFNGVCDSTYHFINLSVNPAASQWTFGDGTTSNNIHAFHTYTTAGSMSVQLITTSQEGCIDTINQTLPVALRNPARFDYLIDSCGGKFIFTNKTTNAASYQWDFGDNQSSSQLNPVHYYQSAGIYNVKLTVNSGNVCVDSNTVTLNAPADGMYTLFIPNSFTPNGDGNNDVFKIYSKLTCDTYSLVVYNRWGEQVFATDDPLNVGWDGTNKGVAIPEGVYVYFLRSSKAQKTGCIYVTR